MSNKTDSRTQPEVKLMPSLEDILSDPEVMEVMIDSFDQIYVEKRGQLTDVPSQYRSNQQLMDELQELAAAVGRRLDESHPIMDLRLWDGSRIHIVIPPIALKGPSVTIRKFSQKAHNAEDLLNFGSWNEEIVTFLRACVIGKINICVAGGTGSGKTTVMNILCGMIPDDERIITAEAASELRFAKKRLVALETRPPNLEGRGEISFSDLIISAIKMRPDRIIAGEVHGGEMIHLLQAINTGHDGCLFTMHANSSRDALARMEVMATMEFPTMPLLAVREQLASALDLIVHMERMRDGQRRISKITEVVEMHGESVQLQDIFEFRPTGFADGQQKGFFTATGIIPRFMSKLRNANIDVPMNLFAPQ